MRTPSVPRPSPQRPGGGGGGGRGGVGGLRNPQTRQSCLFAAMFVLAFASAVAVCVANFYLVYVDGRDASSQMAWQHILSSFADAPGVIRNATTAATATTTRTGPAGAVVVDDDGAAPVVVAYVVSLIKCSKQVNTVGFLDAAAVLRHSIHKTSVHNPRSGSRYSYQMYAIVHSTNCPTHAPALERLGYRTIVRPTPVNLTDIRGEWYRNHVEGENCCGSDEFIKLYSYLLFDHPVVVHLDMDVAMLQPLDELYDSMLYPPTSSRGVEARARIELEHPAVALPERIDAFFTRDVTSAKPWEEHMGVQGGFLVHRPSRTDFDEYVRIILEGNYRPGRGDGSGWAGLGYGGFQGAMAYQGIVAYFYDQVRPGTFVELNVCRYNQVVADVLWRGPERYEDPHKEECRRPPLDGMDHASNRDCEDCRVTPVNLVKSVHYTACKKPWECTVPTPRVPRDKRQVYRLNHLTNVTTCMAMHREWFRLRGEFEDELAAGVSANANAAAGGHDWERSERDGDFERDYFLGYCRGSGKYVPMNAPPDDLDLSKVVYGLK